MTNTTKTNAQIADTTAETCQVATHELVGIELASGITPACLADALTRRHRAVTVPAPYNTIK